MWNTETIRLAFRSQTASWWFEPLAWTILTILLIAIVIAWFPGRTSGPVTPLEVSLSRRKPLLRIAMVCLTLSSVLLIVPGLIALSFSPTPASVVILTSRVGSGRPSSKPEDGLPAGYQNLPRIDAGPLVDAVLSQAAADGAAAWHAARPVERTRLREICLDVLQRYAEGETAGVIPSSGHSDLPHWVIESAEVSVVFGLARLNNIPWAGIAASVVRQDRGWGLAQRNPPFGTDIVVQGETVLPGPRVRLLFAGMAQDGNTHASFQALVENPSATAGAGTIEYPIVVTDRLSGRSMTVAVSVDRSKPIQVVGFNGDIAIFNSSSELIASAEQGQVQTELHPADGPSAGEAVVHINLPAGAGVHENSLSHTWQKFLAVDNNGQAAGDSRFRETLEKRGLRIPRLEFTGGNGTVYPKIVFLTGGHGVAVLAPDLTAGEFQAFLKTNSVNVPVAVSFPSTAATGVDVHQHMWRSSRVNDAAQNVDSWWMAALRPDRVGDEMRIPVPNSTLAMPVSCLRPGAPLESGRLAYADPVTSRLVVRPVIERGTVTGRPFVHFHIDPTRQSLFIDPGTTDPAATFEPGRTRAFLHSLIAAANEVTRPDFSIAMSNSKAAVTDSPRAGLLLSDADRKRLVRSRQQDSDSFAFVCLGLFLISMNSMTYLWRTR